MEKIKAIFNEQVRAYIYRVLAAVGIVVAGYGWMSANDVAMWLGLAAVVFNIMPTINTSVKSVSSDQVGDATK